MSRRKPRGNTGRYGLFDNPGDETAELQDNPLTRSCKHCKATVRQPCTRPGQRGKRVPLKGFHDCRRADPGGTVTQGDVAT